MREYPKDKYDREEIKRLAAEPWMVEVLKCNPSYVFWGVHEDYMSKRSESEGADELGRVHHAGWESRVFIKNWKDFGWKLDELNECVNFYFEINRLSKQCPICDGNGYHPDAQWVSESFYQHSSPFTVQTASQIKAETVLVSFGSKFTSNPHGRGTYPSNETVNKYGEQFKLFCESMRDGDGCWHDKITQDEVDALVKKERVQDAPAEEINKSQHNIGLGHISHDAINRCILIKQRLKRFGIPINCENCEGSGNVFIEDKAHLSLTLWIIHPRKGASRGVEIEKIEQEDLAEVQQWLIKARKRNQRRFSKLSKLAKIVYTKGN